MNKNLENEYKKHIEDQIPDLWDRIEAALPEKNNDSASVNEKNDNIVEFSNKKVEDKIVTAKKVNNKKSKAKIISIISGVAVAMLAGIMIVPVVFNGNGLKTDNAPSVRSQSKDDSGAKNNKSSKADKSSKGLSNFLEGFADSNMDAADAATCADAAPAEEYYDNDAVCEEAEYEEAACEETEYDEAADDYAIDADESPTDKLNSNNLGASAIDSEELVFAFVEQYDTDGNLNFDDDNNLLNDIDDICTSGSVIMTIQDISYAKIETYYDDNGARESVTIRFKFRPEGKSKLEEATSKAVNDNSRIGIYYKGEIVYSAPVVAVISQGMIDATSFDPESGLASEIVGYINKNN